MRILHVEDDESWRQIIQRPLGDHHVDSAKSLRQAIALLQAEPPYDVALVDLYLTTNSDCQGGVLLDLMRIRYPSTRRMVITGRPPVGSMRKDLIERYGLDAIILKGHIDLRDLRRIVEEVNTQEPDEKRINRLTT